MTQTHQSNVSWTVLDTRVYNASVGVGEDACEDAWLDHGTQPRPFRMKAFPTLPLGMLHRNAPPLLAPWRNGADAALGELVEFDKRNLVHGDQTIVWHSCEVPAVAQCTARHRIVNMVQKRTGVVATSETEFNVGGNTICTSIASMFLRGGKLTAAGRAIPTASGTEGAVVSHALQALMGAQKCRPTSPAQEIQLRTSPNQAALYAINGDDNPIHVDWSVAREAGFGSPILHGLCTFGMAFRGILRVAAAHWNVAPSDVVPVACTVRFVRPVLPGQTLIVKTAQVAAAQKDEMTVVFSVAVGDTVVCSRCAATLRKPQSTSQSKL